MTREEKAQFCIDNPKESPAFQFYPNSWWRSRHVAGMTPEERGIHASLIFSAWLEKNCGIPENEVCLSARVNESLKPIVEKVLSWCWFLYSHFWFSEKLLNERIKQIELSNTRQIAGSKGGRPVESRIKKKKPIANQLDSKRKPNDNQMITKLEARGLEARGERLEATGVEEDSLIKDILTYLNKKCNTHYRTDTGGFISGRLSEGFTIDDFKKVIDKKYKQWIDDVKMQKFIRPITLFSPEHFQQYLNEIDKPVSDKTGITHNRMAEKMENFIERHQNDQA